MCFVDVITIEKTGEFFRLIYDVKGRFAIHRITAEEAKVSNNKCSLLNYNTQQTINSLVMIYFSNMV